jgi:hypothetical protein
LRFVPRSHENRRVSDHKTERPESASTELILIGENESSRPSTTGATEHPALYVTPQILVQGAVFDHHLDILRPIAILQAPTRPA